MERLSKHILVENDRNDLKKPFKNNASHGVKNQSRKKKIKKVYEPEKRKQNKKKMMKRIELYQNSISVM